MTRMTKGLMKENKALQRTLTEYEGLLRQYMTVVDRQQKEIRELRKA